MAKKCILIIEDEADILAVYKEFLENSGFEVDTASNGETGLDKILKGKPDVILLDIMMPKLDGIGILQTVRDQKRKLPDTIMLTNLAHDKSLQEALDLGAKECVIKSEITPDKLLEKINHLLET